MTQFGADYNGMQSIARKISQSASDYNTRVMELYNIVSELEQVWKGNDNIAYVNRINRYKDDILRLGKIVKSYAEFLNNAAIMTSDIQNDISAAAGH